MSGTAAQTRDPHDRDHDHDDAHGADAMHFSVRGYLTGFALSLALTAVPFWLVMARVIPGSTATAVVILAFAVVQIFVHMVYFLHLDTKSEGGWNLLSLIFALVLVVIVLSGSMWVMHHLDANMMPATMHEMRNMP